MSSLLDIWENPETSGIFTVLNNYEVPWKSQNVYESLNLAYYYNHAGQKNISPLVSGILGSDTLLNDAEKTKIGKVVFDMCNQNWQYEWDAMFTDYNPIENYNADETETITHGGNDTLSKTGTDAHALSGADTEHETGTNTISNSGNDTVTNTGTTTDTNKNENGTTETKNQIYGFNSTDAADDSTSTTTVNQTITDTREDNLTATTTHGLKTDDTRNMSNTTTYGRTDTENIDITEKTDYNNNENRTLKRHGNIGVTTSQQMIESELELRKKFFYEIVFRDIDHYLTLSVY